MQSKPGRNSPTPEIGLECFLTQQPGAISSKTTPKDSTTLILLFIDVVCASLLLGMRRHLQQHEVARLIQMLEMILPNETSREPLMSPRAWCLGPGTGTWQLVATSDVPDKDTYDEQPLAKTATSTKWPYVAVTVLPEHSRLTSRKPQDSESVTKLCTTDSVRTAFTADDQYVVPFSPGNNVELDLTLPRIINIGSCVNGVPFSSQTSLDSMSLLVTDV